MQSIILLIHSAGYLSNLLLCSVSWFYGNYGKNVSARNIQRTPDVSADKESDKISSSHFFCFEIELFRDRFAEQFPTGQFQPERFAVHCDGKFTQLIVHQGISDSQFNSGPTERCDQRTGCGYFNCAERTVQNRRFVVEQRGDRCVVRSGLQFRCIAQNFRQCRRKFAVTGDEIRVSSLRHVASVINPERKNLLFRFFRVAVSQTEFLPACGTFFNSVMY